jgi:ABC-2 type transport system ATP-binding protein
MNRTGLTVQGLVAAYGSSTVLKGVDLTIPAGHYYVLLGENGSGKSTLIDCVVGRRTPVAGRVAIDGVDHAEAPREARRLLGYACPPEQLPGLLTVRECFEVHAAAKGLGDVEEPVQALARALGLEAYSGAWVDTLSLGTRQKLSILLALVGNPRLIVLDEVFNGLDARSALIVKNSLRERAQAGASILLATHDLGVVLGYADSAGLLHAGRIAQEWDRASLDRHSGLGVEALERVLSDAISNADSQERR